MRSFSSSSCAASCAPSIVLRFCGALFIGEYRNGSERRDYGRKAYLLGVIHAADGGVWLVLLRINTLLPCILYTGSTPTDPDTPSTYFVFNISIIITYQYTNVQYFLAFIAAPAMQLYYFFFSAHLSAAGRTVLAASSAFNRPLVFVRVPFYPTHSLARLLSYSRLHKCRAAMCMLGAACAR